MSQDKNSTETPVSPAQPDAIQLMMQMQKQQMDMQEKFTALMSQFLPPAAANVPPPPPQSRPNRAKLDRPTIDADCTDNRWIIFRDAWNRYKEMASLSSAAEIRNELRSACSPKVNEMLFNFVGPDALNTASEEALMDFIKSVAVKVVHPEVYRQQFFTLRQSDCESITNFISTLSRLKAQAMLCAFNGKGSCTQNTCVVSYSEDMVKSQLIAGLRNPSHQSKVLSEMEVLKTLEQVTARLLALESTEKASSHLRPSVEVAAISNQQPNRNGNRKIPPADASRSKNCSGCGQLLHPKGRTACPAWQKNCRKCGKPNHFAGVCRSSNTSVSASTTVDEESIILAPVQTKDF